MSMMDKDQVSWDRKTENGVDALGHPNLVSVSGFPRTVRGNFQEAARRADKSDRTGIGVQLDATLFSDTYVDGKNGDLVTVSGRAYMVIDAPVRRGLFSSSPAFAKYGLTLNITGVAQPAGA